MARSARAGMSLYRFLILPASLPTFVAGLKQGWAFAWRSLMAGELLVTIANQPSIGVLLSTYQDLDDMASTVAIMIVILIIGLLVDSAFGAATKRSGGGGAWCSRPARFPLAIAVVVTRC